MGMKANHAVVSENQRSEPERWVDQHGDSLYRYALMRLRDRELAEDIVQETFLAALKARDRFAGQSSERTWLIGILKHKIVDHFRRSSREVALGDEELLSGDIEDAFRETGEWIGHWKERQGPMEWAADPRATLEKKEFWAIFERCLSDLPPRLAQVFMLRELDELSTEEICQTMNISANNLWVMLHRARAQLRQSLEVNYFGQFSETPKLVVRNL